MNGQTCFFERQCEIVEELEIETERLAFESSSTTHCNVTLDESQSHRTSVLSSVVGKSKCTQVKAVRRFKCPST